MAARKHPAVTPALTVLQLDTQFPRIAGDVGCADTYAAPVEIIRVPQATVANVVSDRPDLIDIVPFQTALKAAQADVVVTSCGFLSYWQTLLASQTSKTFISSALVALEKLSHQYAPGEVLILTFDATRLTRQHLRGFEDYATGIVGLPDDMHLRQVIEQDRSALDAQRAGRELTAFVAAQKRDQHKHILLECTNLPPYKSALADATGLPVTDILTLINAAKPSAVRPEFR